MNFSNDSGCRAAFVQQLSFPSGCFIFCDKIILLFFIENQD